FLRIHRHAHGALRGLDPDGDVQDLGRRLLEFIAWRDVRAEHAVRGPGLASLDRRLRVRLEHAAYGVRRPDRRDDIHGLPGPIAVALFGEPPEERRRQRRRGLLREWS